MVITSEARNLLLFGLKRHLGNSRSLTAWRPLDLRSGLRLFRPAGWRLGRCAALPLPLSVPPHL